MRVEASRRTTRCVHRRNISGVASGVWPDVKGGHLSESAARDRVGCRGLRLGTLPHHRTCGFPHPAVGPSRSLPSQARSPGTPNTPTGWGPSAFGQSLASPRWRPQLSRPAASFVLSSSSPAPWLVLFGPSALRIGSPFGSCVPPALLRPLLTSHRLSAAGSPRVDVCSVRSRLWALRNVASGSWASCLLAYSPPTSSLLTHLCSFGRALASRPFAPPPRGDDLAVRLRLAPQAPGGNVSSRKSRHLPGTRAPNSSSAW
jgi:hypothetical protein